MGKIMKSGVDYSAPPMIDSYTKVESDGRYIPMTGGTVTGQITTNQTTFTTDNQLVSKKYVDDLFATLIDADNTAY